MKNTADYKITDYDREKIQEMLDQLDNYCTDLGITLLFTTYGDVRAIDVPAEDLEVSVDSEDSAIDDSAVALFDQMTCAHAWNPDNEFLIDNG